ncbi:hypothetical protein FBEOM_910 [Fusarium beomiforme]|uniref:Uncharacterized protein n=1 Tax=Fusarium beomiforme TaxID=44412 RepID=A0A9P5AU45_9HYPO|nr:hypothetical protein FBEOM_910 [Fusarium beomiforme]
MSLPGKFIIVVDGKPVANPQENGEPFIQAQSGDPPAIFELRGGRLISGDWALGRLHFEDRSLLPKRLLWRRKEEVEELQPVQVEEYGGPPELKFSGIGYHPIVSYTMILTAGNAGAGLAFIDDKLFAPLLEGERQSIEIRPVPF